MNRQSRRPPPEWKIQHDGEKKRNSTPNKVSVGLVDRTIALVGH